MAVSTYEEYLAAMGAIEAEQRIALEVAARKHERCYRTAKAVLDSTLDNIASMAGLTSEEAGALRATAYEVYRQQTFECDRELEEKRDEIFTRSQTQLSALHEEAYNALVRLGRLIITLAGLKPLAESHDWMNGPDKPPPILVVTSIAELRAEFERDRFVNELLLIMQADDRNLVFGSERGTVTELALAINNSVQMHVDDVVYVEGQLSGTAPDDLDTLRILLGAGRLESSWNTITSPEEHQEHPEEEVCLPPGRLIGKVRARLLGPVAEQAVLRDYCRQFSCDPYFYNNGRDYFDNIFGGLSLYVSFLFMHNPHLTPSDQNEILRRSRIKNQVGRPDILSDHWPRSEFYEIKPGSRSGIKDGDRKIADLAVFYDEFNMKYPAGVRFQPHEYYYLTERQVFGENITFYLRVNRIAPGFIVYRLCARGRISKAVRRLVILALSLIALLVIIGEIVPVPVPAPVPVPIPEPIPIPA